MSAAKLFFAGMPIDPDVRRLSDKYGIPTAGTLIPHEDIAAVINAKWGSSRYKTVLAVWRRKLMKEPNVDTAILTGKGLKVLTPPERVDASESDFKSSVRKGRRAAIRAQVIPDEGLTDEQRQHRDHVRTVTARAYMVQANEAKALKQAPPKPPQALPRAQAK